MTSSATLEAPEVHESTELQLPDMPVVVGDSPAESPATDETSGQEAAELAAAVEAPAIDPRAQLESQIKQQQIEVANLAVSHSRKQSSAKAAKKELDLAVEELRDLEGRLEQGEFSLPFMGYAADGATGSSLTAPLPGQLELPIDDNAWKSVPISELGLTGKLAESLTEAGLTTLGAIADHSAAGKQLIDIDGIGPGKAEKVEKACEEYWARNPRVAGQDVPVVSEVSEDRSAVARAAGSESAEETAQYAAGCEAMLEATEAAVEDEDPVMPENPHKPGTRLWKMFDKGVQDVLAN